MTEKAWQQQVLEVSTLCRWQHFHVFDSRRSDPGWPDLVLVREPELLVAELKTDRGRLTVEQARWLERLVACGVEAHVWRPRDFDEMWQRLSTGARIGRA